MRLTRKNKAGRYGFITENNTLGIFDENSLADKCYTKLGQLEDIEEWFSKKRFYGKALNEPNKILELEFDKLDFRPEEDLLLIHFKVLNSWATNIFYNILSYGKSWALTKGELL